MEETVGPVSTCGRELLREWRRPINLMVSFMIFTASVRKILDQPSYMSHRQEAKNSWTSLLLKFGPVGCPETSVRNYHYTLRNIPKGGRSHLHLGGSVKWSIIGLNSLFMFTYHTFVPFAITITWFLIFRQRKKFCVISRTAAPVATISLRTISRCSYPMVLTSTDSRSQYGYGCSMAIFRILTIIKGFLPSVVLSVAYTSILLRINCVNF